MLNISASLAAIILTTWFLVLAWLRAYESSWSFYLLAGLLILAWSRPWSNRDRYRTYDSRLRMLTYFVLAAVTVSGSYFFLTPTPLLLTFEVLILALLEVLGWMGMRRA